MLGIGNYVWRLIPANPILLRVVESGGKRKRDLFIRCAYLGFLLGVVIWLLLFSAGSLSSASLAELSKTSSNIFYTMSYVQLGLVTLLAPIFTAGAITQEKDSQTYDILLSTPLTNGQIVLGSLLSRLFFVVALLVSGIPIFSITQIFGGVAISSIVMSIAIAAATAFLTGAIAMAIAVFKVGTRRTIFSFYLVIMLFVAIPLTIESMGYMQVPGSKPGSHISWFAGIHPFLALRVIFGEPTYNPPDPAMVSAWGYGRIMRWYLSSPHTFYVSFMTLMSFVLVTPSIVFLRRLAQSNLTFQGWLLQKLHISSGNKTRKPRHVWGNPIAWREAKTKASANRAVILRYGFMLAGLAGAVVLLVMSSTVEESPAYIGSGAFNPGQGTLTVVKNGQATTYAVTPRTVVNVTESQNKLALTDLREGMVVDPNAIFEAPGATRRTLSSITVSEPKLLLSARVTKQFLLGAVMIELAVILLIVTQSAASTVTREKEDGTLDLLLTTPITSRYYIWGKLRGLVSFAMPLMAVPVLSVLLFVVWGMVGNPPWSRTSWMVYPEAVVVLPGTLVMVSAFAAILGMQMSLRCRKTVMAVMSSLGIVAGVCGGLWVCGGNAASSKLGAPGLAIGSFSPFTLMSLLINPQDAAVQSYSTSLEETDSRLMVFFAGWIATGVYTFVVWGMYKSMVRNFDMTIRRQAT